VSHWLDCGILVEIHGVAWLYVQHSLLCSPQLFSLLFCHILRACHPHPHPRRLRFQARSGLHQQEGCYELYILKC